MNKAYKFRIYPTTEQAILIQKTFGCVRFIYNHMLHDKMEYYKETGENLKRTPAQYKTTFQWLKEVDSLALANAQLQLNTAYQNFFKRPECGFPKFKSKRHPKKSYTTNCVNQNIRLEHNILRLPKLGLVKVKQHREIPEGWAIKSVTVSQSATGKYYASILFEYESQVTERELKTFLGLDFSMKELYVDSEGHYGNYPRFYRKSEEKLGKEQRKLSHMEKGSSNYKKQRQKVAKIHEKIANQRKDFLHKESRRMADAYDGICIEDLDMRAMSKSLHFGKSVHDNGWGMFTIFLSYKLAEAGKRLIKVDRFFPSSQLCSNCGYQNKDVKDLSVREWVCPICGKRHDRDENAAVNIKNEGMRLAFM